MSLLITSLYDTKKSHIIKLIYGNFSAAKPDVKRFYTFAFLSCFHLFILQTSFNK